MSKPAQKRKSVKALMTRDNLSFTARVPSADGLDCPLLSNWSPVEVPYQHGQWSIGHALGAKMIDELCSGQLIPDTTLSFSSARAGANPSLN